MDPRWSLVCIPTASGPRRSWAVITCPRCGGAVLLELQAHVADVPANTAIALSWSVTEIRSVPDTEHSRSRIGHLPEDVARFFADAVRVLDAGVPGAAAVQLRRTLEAAAAHRGIQRKTLVQSIQEMIDKGLVTQDFAEVLTHVRKVGNQGAHYSDEEITEAEVHRALRFTTQFLRNVFEVPGELAELKAESTTES